MPEQVKEEAKQVEIIEKVEEVAKEVTAEDIATLDPIEQELANKHLPKKEEVKAKEEVKEETKEEAKEIKFEDAEKDQSIRDKFTLNEKALYRQWKEDKGKRQTAQRDAELAVIREKALKKELDGIKGNENITAAKLKQINELLNGDADNITIEAIQEILQTKKEEAKDRPVTIKDLEDIDAKKQLALKEEHEKQQRFVNRVNEAEALGKSKYDNYEDIIDAANEVLSGNVELPSVIDSKELSNKFVEMMYNESKDLDTIADFVHGIAKLNPNFGKPKTELKKETNENIDRIVKNASKQQTSASVSSGNGRRLVSVEDITLEDAAKLSSEKYGELPKHVRERLKKESQAI